MVDIYVGVGCTRITPWLTSFWKWCSIEHVRQGRKYKILCIVLRTTLHTALYKNPPSYVAAYSMTLLLCVTDHIAFAASHTTAAATTAGAEHAHSPLCLQSVGQHYDERHTCVVYAPSQVRHLTGVQWVHTLTVSHKVTKCRIVWCVKKGNLKINIFYKKIIFILSLHTLVHCKCIPSVEACYKCMPSSEAHCKYLPSSEAYCKCMPSSEAHCKYLPSSEAYCKCMPSEAHCKYLPSSEALCKFMPSSGAHCNCMPYSEALCKFMPSSEAHCIIFLIGVSVKTD